MGPTRKECSHSLSLGQGEVRGRILFSGCLGGSVHLGACLVPLKRHRPWQQRALSAYLTVKACEKEERSGIGGARWRERGGWKGGRRLWKSLGVGASSSPHERQQDTFQHKTVPLFCPVKTFAHIYVFSQLGSASFFVSSPRLALRLHCQTCCWPACPLKTGNVLKAGPPPSCSNSRSLCCIHRLLSPTWPFSNPRLRPSAHDQIQSAAPCRRWRLPWRCCTLADALHVRGLGRSSCTGAQQKKQNKKKRRLVFVCAGGAGMCAESRIALGIPDLFWLLRLQLLHRLGEEGPGRSKTTKF